MDGNVTTSSVLAWWQLLRLHKPVGAFLVLWPSLLALFHAAFISTLALPALWHIILFTIGAFASRAAGCIANDLWDSDIDPKVERTKNRPLANGSISKRAATIAMLILFAVCALIALMLDIVVFGIALLALPWIALYPYAKRIIKQPQLILTITFSFGIPMGYAVFGMLVSVSCLLLWLANLTWIYAYDTIYAMADKADDARIGVGSSALYWGKYDFVAVAIAQILTVSLLLWWIIIITNDITSITNTLSQKHNIASLSTDGAWLWIALGIIGLGFLWQQLYIRQRTIRRCIAAFTSNHYLQCVLLASLAICITKTLTIIP